MRIPKSARDDDICHVVPIDDDRDHDHESRGKCWFRPQIEEDGLSWIVIHNSADGRESYELGMRKPH